MEEFKPIKDYESYYEISNHGNVKSLHERYKKCIFKKPYIRKDGYVVVNLIKNKKQTTFYLHRLVASHFLTGEIDELMTEVNHIDGDKRNNHYKNLEWCTISDNKRHAYNIGLTKVGSRRSSSKLTEDMVLKMPGLIKGGMTIKDMSKLFNVSTTSIHHILKGRNYAFLNLDFGYTFKKYSKR